MPQIARKAGIEFYLFNRPRDPSRPPIEAEAAALVAELLADEPEEEIAWRVSQVLIYQKTNERKSG
jgi:hypothetical protein